MPTCWKTHDYLFNISIINHYHPVAGVTVEPSCCYRHIFYQYTSLQEKKSHREWFFLHEVGYLEFPSKFCGLVAASGLLVGLGAYSNSPRHFPFCEVEFTSFPKYPFLVERPQKLSFSPSDLLLLLQLYNSFPINNIQTSTLQTHLA